MSLSEALVREVPERTRTKGNRYFLGGAVRSLEGSDWHVDATVRGSRIYEVQLTRAGDEVRASCECPFFTDRRLACKHVWAVILAADAEGYLRGDPAPNGRVYLETTLPPFEEDAGPPAPAGEPGGGAPPAPQRWQAVLQRVEERARRLTAPASRLARGRILYVLQADESIVPPVPTLHVRTQIRKRNGDWAKPQPAMVSHADLDQVPDPADREILAHLIGVADPYVYPPGPPLERSAFRLAGPLVDRLLPLLARSGRLYLARTDDPAAVRAARPAHLSGSRPGAARTEARPLEPDEGGSWELHLDVEMSDQRIHVAGRLDRAGERMDVRELDALLTPRLAAARGALVAIEATGLLPWLLELWRSGPIVLPPSAAASLAESMALSGVPPDRLPDSLRYEVVEPRPVPRIRMARTRRSAYSTAGDLEASVSFEYAGSVFASGQAAIGYDAARRRMVRRDAAAETSALDRLQQLGFRRHWPFGQPDGVLSVPVDRFPAIVRALVRDGWHVEAEGRVIRAPQGMRMQVRSGVDWFELHGQVDFGEGRSASIVALLAALRRGDATIVLDDGTRGMIPEEWLKKYARIAGFGQAGDDHVRYARNQAALLDALLESQPAVSADETFARARAQLAAFDRIRSMNPPAGFRGTLREYQREALGWFQFLRRFGFGGCLADDMGLGKTVMVLALLESRRKARDRGAPRSSIVVVPRSLVFNWKAEAAVFAPGLRVLDYTGEGRDAAPFDDCDVLLTTYGTLRQDAARLATREFDYVILDEAQAIKNPATAAAKAARLLGGRHRLALSGTPVENHVGELWSLFEFLNPGFLGPAAAFGRSIASQGRERPDLALVARALKPFILRRTKEQVAPELPARTEQTIHCDLEPAERRVYDELRDHYRQTLLARIARSGLGRSKLQVLEALLRLRQAALHPGLVDPRRAGESSSKLDLLLTRLREVIDEGHKALVFSQFTSLLGLLRPRLEAEQIAYEYLDGQTRDRAARVARFDSDPQCPVFLISLKAGGVGLNLTAADYVFLLDPWWNPAVEAQAIDRTHRIGQARQVFAYRLIARDTVEEKIAELQRSKRELAGAILGEEAGLIGSLRAEDLDWLLG